jgi:hypothetical protein
VKSFVFAELKNIYFFVKNPPFFTGLDVVFLNIWIAFCYHLQNIKIDSVASSDCKIIVQSGLKFMIENAEIICSAAEAEQDDHHELDEEDHELDNE